MVPVINVGHTEVTLNPWTRLVGISVAEVVLGVVNQLAFQEVGPQALDVSVCTKEATMGQLSTGILNCPFNINCPQLDVQQLAQMRCLLDENTDMSAGNDSELGCTEVIRHEIHLLDNTPVKQRYCGLPPNQCDEVKTHIKQLLQQGVDKEN